MGKGAKERIVPIGATARGAIVRYLGQRGPGPIDAPLFRRAWHQRPGPGAVLATDPRPADLEGFDAIHRPFVVRHPEWAGRLEVVYISRGTLRTVRTKVGRLAVISPGEPLNLRDADRH